MKGFSFWRKDDDGPDTHLRFVISEPDINGMVLVVGMTSYHGRKGQDTSCILNNCDHPKVYHTSCIRYDKAIELDYRKIMNEHFQGLIKREDDLSESTLRRIQDGAKISQGLKIKYQKYFDSF